MKNQIIHTPEGVRDIYNVECRKKLILQERLHDVLHLYGYQDIQTPSFEFFEVFRKEIGTIASKELYKFFDREGNTMALRPDITPSIARAAATLYEGEELPIRLCYIGNTFINHSSYQGRLKETTQLGAELIGVDSVDADAEMLAMVIDCLKKAGLEDFQLTIGNVEFFESLIQAGGFEEKIEEQVRDLIKNRNFFGIDEVFDHIEVSQNAKDAFAMLPSLIGTVEILEEAKKIAPDAKAARGIRRLERIYKVLRAYGVEKYITFDLSMCGTYDYYTGIIFRAYTFGTGDAIVKGGRYDHLLEKFGKVSPSIGFAIVADELMNALNRQKIEIPCEFSNFMILYDEERRFEAIKLARKFRRNQKNTELIKKNPQKELEEYYEHGRQNLAGSMIYLGNEDKFLMMDLITGEELMRSED